MAPTPRPPPPESGTRAAVALLATLLVPGFLLLIDSLGHLAARRSTSSAAGPRLLVTQRLLSPAPPCQRPAAAGCRH